MAEFLYAWSLGMSKLAILCFYWRLFSVSNIRPGIYILGACTIIWLTIRTFMTIFHCIPVQAYWNFNIKDAVCTIDPGKFMFGTTLVHLLLEISVLLLPVFQVASLRLRPGQKFAVVAMFMFGILPVFRKFLSGSILGSKSHSTGPNPLSDFSGKGIKLRNSHRTKELDDNSSERQLAQHEDGSSGRGDMYYESYAERGGYNKTVVSRVDEVPDGNANAPGTYGIQVRNETNVRYESI
ncbi:unnamed protein product [Alternaria alternata]